MQHVKAGFAVGLTVAVVWAVAALGATVFFFGRWQDYHSSLGLLAQAADPRSYWIATALMVWCALQVLVAGGVTAAFGWQLSKP